MKALRSLKLGSSSSHKTSGSDTDTPDGSLHGGSPSVAHQLWPVPLHPDAYEAGGLCCNDEVG